jgi:hypothetical protein
MVGDLHFVIRHGLTGFIFLLFIVFGMWNVELWVKGGCDLHAYVVGDSAVGAHCMAVKAATALKDAPLLIFVLATIVGISLQGAHIYREYSSGRLFADRARRLIAERTLSVMRHEEIEGLESCRRSSFLPRVEEISEGDPDAIYVWLYHDTKDNELLIEWARRRRSYHYLGIHCYVSFVAGTLIGAVVAFVASYPLRVNVLSPDYLFLQLALQAALLVLAAVWAIRALQLSRRMRDEADSMEFMWSVGCIYPEFKKKVRYPCGCS